MSNLPEAQFDAGLAELWFPRPTVKYAALVPIPHEFPTFIQPEWDEEGTSPQVFYGDYYLILDERGRGRYGSAKLQWESMHRQLPMRDVLGGISAMAWVKVLVPKGYLVPNACELVTMIPTEDGQGIRESRKAIKPGTLVLQQPGGEFQFVRPQDQNATYFSPQEARHLGLTRLTIDQFADWAVQAATGALAPAR